MLTYTVPYMYILFVPRITYTWSYLPPCTEGDTAHGNSQATE